MTELLSGKPIGDILSYLGNLVSEFSLTYCGGLIDEDSALRKYEKTKGMLQVTHHYTFIRRTNPNTQPSHEAFLTP